MKKNQLVYWFCVLGLILSNVIFAQNGSDNPFQLHRGKGEEVVAPTNMDRSKGNPFELVHKSSASPTINADTAKTVEIAKPSNPFQLRHNTATEDIVIAPQEEEEAYNPFKLHRVQKNRAVVSTLAKTKPKVKTGSYQPLSGLFRLWSLVGISTILTLIIILFNSNVQKVYRSFTNSNFLKMVHREQSGSMRIPYLILFFVSCFSVGYFVFLTMKYYKIPSSVTNIQALMGTGIALFAFFVVKYFFTSILGAVFSISKTTSRYSFLLLVTMVMLGFLLIPSNLLLVAPSENFDTLAIYLGFAIIGIISAYLILRSLLLANKHIGLHPFHFFVYLCTVEIAPILILLKIGGVF